MKKLWETGILLFAVAGFWGMIYPDLCFISDVCHVEEYTEETVGQTEDSGENCGSQKGAFAENVAAEQMGDGTWAVYYTTMPLKKICRV